MQKPPRSLSRRAFLRSLSVLGFSPFVLPRASHAAALTDPGVVDVARVWAGHPVGFALLTKGDCQFVAYYDAHRQMTLAQRKLGDKTWVFRKLPTFVQWDSHNSIAMALDSANCLHISGNMHAVPLVYFRGSKPLDIASVEMIDRMVGQNESRVTYPRFFYGPFGELIYSYRDGRSGDGNNILNIYNPGARTWRRLLDKPLMDGTDGAGGTMNAYMQTPEKGPDGNYHVSWIWRNTPDAATCHDLSYMRSPDLIHWETINGQPLKLPITIATADVIVDPVPIHSGILNGMGRIGFDFDNRVILSYAKYDANQKTQLYLARFENGGWQHHLASDWNEHFAFSGGGSLTPEIHLGGVERRDGKLVISILRLKHESGDWEIDPQTMKLARLLPAPPLELAFRRFDQVESSFPGMKVRWSTDQGHASDGRTYRLRWETLAENRDKPRDPPWPPASMLRVIGGQAV